MIAEGEDLMKTWNGIRIAVAAAVLFAAGIASAQNITGQVVGRVLDAETGKPIAGAQVTAAIPSWVAQVVTTDSRGQYVIPLLPPNRYDISVTAPGYLEALPREVWVAIDWRIRNDVRLLSAKGSGRVPAGSVAQNR